MRPRSIGTRRARVRWRVAADNALKRSASAGDIKKKKLGALLRRRGSELAAQISLDQRRRDKKRQPKAKQSTTEGVARPADEMLESARRSVVRAQPRHAAGNGHDGRRASEAQQKRCRRHDVDQRDPAVFGCPIASTAARQWQ